MRLTTRQAAEKIGVSTYVVKDLAKRGILTDIGVTQEGSIRHFLVFDSKQVNEVAKEYKPRARFFTSTLQNNGSKPVTPKPADDEMVPHYANVTPSPATGIISTLSRLEKSVEELKVMVEQLTKLLM